MAEKYGFLPSKAGTAPLEALAEKLLAELVLAEAAPVEVLGPAPAEVAKLIVVVGGLFDAGYVFAATAAAVDVAAAEAMAGGNFAPDRSAVGQAAGTGAAAVTAAGGVAGACVDVLAAVVHGTSAAAWTTFASVSSAEELETIGELVTARCGVGIVAASDAELSLAGAVAKVKAAVAAEAAAKG